MHDLCSARPCLTALLAAWLLAGCATGSMDSPAGAQPVDPPRRQLSDLVPAGGVADPIAVHDPLEPANRSLYTFNARFDRVIFIPVVETYETVTPEFLRDRVSSFFLNLGEVNNFTNSVLQANVEKAGTTVMRFALNSTVGLLGLFDVASELGIPRQDEDFGQTLGRWGVGPGPYVVLPILGPSSVRDGVGRVADALTLSFAVPSGVSDTTAYDVAQYGLQPVDTRYRTAFRYYGTGSPFEYELVRYVYMEARQLQVRK
ncbi:VacJ family lipoprotein [Azospirillum sp. SYSU D00513]|uniref:MlaA family lipoprotein n=1 Tax=Azospirillum sp. SYSU D00513 TaxID=2812561 RepID=UPI001A958EB7|nr:VacJ family lipoprotein [Azospirillum sp. SYSU D00513]